MKKIDLGQTITLLANIGVIAGIAFLAFELRQNNQLLRAEAGYNLLQNRAAFRDSIVRDPELAKFWVEALDNAALSATDLRIRMQTERTFLNWQWEYGQYVEGNLAEGEFSIPALRQSFSGERGVVPVFREAWDAFKGDLRLDFVRWMEENVVDQ